MLSKKITESQSLNCEIDLLQFHFDFQDFYGLLFITFNVHALSHLPTSVRYNGPLSASSTYGFESNIFNLKLKVSGPNGAMKQMACHTLR